MRRLLALLAFPGMLLALDGTVVNGTTGMPQAGVTVNLIKITQEGMAPAGSAKTGADGKFNIVSPPTAGPVLIQALYQNVSYSLSVPPGRPDTGLQVAVYDATTKPVAKVEQHMVLLETDGKDMVVNETVMYKNDTKQTWADPEKGTLRLFIPDVAKENLRARATAPGGMPVERELKPSKEKGVYQLPFPIKPGETRFDVSYKLPVKEPITFASHILHPEGQVFVLVPPGIEVESADLTPRGQEPTTKANAYEVKNRQYSLKLTGTGALRGTGEDNNAQEDDTPRITQIDPRIYDRLIPILALSLVVLALGFFALYRRT